MSNFPAVLPHDPAALDDAIKVHEDQAKPLKDDAQARIIWHNKQQKDKTPFSIVYLHGFKGSQGEGYPVHQTIAQTLGCNLYLARLHGHGLKRAQNLVDISVNKLLQSAEDACRIGQKIGDRIILMGTSTGASLALHAAASQQFASSIEALVLYSPLVHLYGINSLLLEHHWGRAFLRLFPGKNYRVSGDDPFLPDEGRIWYHSYQLHGALTLGQTVQSIMKPRLFRQVKARTFIGYYYKDRHEHDRIVSTSAIKRMARQLGTPSSEVVLKNFPEAGSHVICNSLLSNAVQHVIRETKLFLNQNVSPPAVK